MSGPGGSGPGAEHDGGAEEPGSGLPPKARAYDLRTGEPLDDDPTVGAGQSGGQYDTSDLGIWAPSREESDEWGGPASSGPAYGGTNQQPYRPQQYQPTPPAPAQYQQPPPHYQPTPPPPTQIGSQHPPSVGGAGWAPTQGGAPPPRRGNGVLLAALAGLLVVVVAVLVTVLLLRGSSKPPVVANQNGTGSPTPAPATPSSGTSSTAGSGTSAQLVFLRTVDGILNQSSSGRQQVASAVTGVQNGCTTSPSSASETMTTVIGNRTSVLAQANALSAPDAATASVKSELVAALNASIAANRDYQQWFDDLTASFPDASPPGCPGGSAPTDSNFAAASAASGRATSAKQAFVADYNPLAAAAGLRTWTESEF
jgi:hypothetical protein